MIDFNRFRQPTGGGGTGYRIYDTFMNGVLPGIKGARERNRRYAESQDQVGRDFELEKMDRANNYQLQRDRLNTIAEMQMQQQRTGPQNVVLDRFNEISPFQREQLRLREKEIDRRDEWDAVRRELEGMKFEETKRKNMAGEEIRRDTAEIAKFKAENPNARMIEQLNGDIIAINPATGREIARFGPSGKLGDKEKIETKAAADIKVNTERDASAERRAEEGGWSIANIPDPTDPTKSISVRVNARTGQVLPLGTQGPISKPATDTSAKDAAKAAEDAKEQEKMDMQAETKANELVATLDELLTSEDKLTSGAEWFTGKSNVVPWNWIPGDVTGAKKAGNSLNKLKSQLTLDLIAELRNNSKTGSTGLGSNLSNKDLGVLERVASGEIDPSIEEKDIQDILVKLRQGFRGRSEELKSKRGKTGMRLADPNTSNATKADIDKRVQEAMRRNNLGGR